MKKIVTGEELKRSMKEAINILCDTVKCTLGPKGSNIIIDHSNFSPFITNDGVTIAESIESEDEVVNVILELAKEASIMTNKTVGDGTTTTLVLLQSLFNLSMDLIDIGYNPIILKKELLNSLDKILKIVEKEKRPINDKLIFNIANIASNDEKIANVVSDVFMKIPYKEAVNIKEVEENIIDVNYYKGYTFQSSLASPLLLKDQSSLVFNDVEALIIDDELTDLENINVVLNEVFNTKKCLFIVANDFSDYVINNITSYVLDGELNCVLVKISDYGTRLRNIQKDIEIISGAKIINNERDVNVQYLGHFKNIFVTKYDVRIDFINNEMVSKYVLDLDAELSEIKDDYLKEFYLKRISMFDKGTAEILIGGYTKTELREKRMRLDDALCAVYSSREGVLVGGGVTYLKISSLLNETNEIEKIWKNALEMPFKELMHNSGLDYENIKEKIVNEKYNLVYNVSKDCLEKRDETDVIDSYKVVVNSLINSCSIASMLITTNSLVINEQLNNLNKVTEYGDI